MESREVSLGPLIVEKHLIPCPYVYFRKYLKKLEDEDKWSCLNCDPSPLREHRAQFWAITRFHKVCAKLQMFSILTWFLWGLIDLSCFLPGEVECQDGESSSTKSEQSCHTQEEQQGELNTF